jgi:hypothetical protein
MPGNKSRTNPFYVLLVIFGIAFSLTACAYGVMAFRAVRGAGITSSHEHRDTSHRSSDPSGPTSDRPATETPAGEALLKFLDEHGALLLGVELVLLALATFGAIGSDGYWSRATVDRSNVESDKRRDQ